VGRYQELNDLYWTERAEFVATVRDAQRLALDLVAAIRERWEAPVDAVRIIPLDGEPEPGAQYDIAEELVVIEGWYHFRFEIDLRSDVRHLAIAFRVALDRREDAWSIETDNPAGDDFLLRDGHPEDWDRFLDGLHADLREFLENAAWHKARDERRIGFHLDRGTTA
jgi:hypothetical protein